MFKYSNYIFLISVCLVSFKAFATNDYMAYKVHKVQKVNDEYVINVFLDSVDGKRLSYQLKDRWEKFYDVPDVIVFSKSKQKILHQFYISMTLVDGLAVEVITIDTRHHPSVPENILSFTVPVMKNDEGGRYCVVTGNAIVRVDDFISLWNGRGGESYRQKFINTLKQAQPWCEGL